MPLKSVKLDVFQMAGFMVSKAVGAPLPPGIAKEIKLQKEAAEKRDKARVKPTKKRRK